MTAFTARNTDQTTTWDSVHADAWEMNAASTKGSAMAAAGTRT